MLEPIVSFFDKLIDEFTWRRLLFLAVLLSIAALSIWTYEEYTQQFKLNRIEKQITLLAKLSEVAAKPEVKSNATFKALQQKIERQLTETTQVASVEYELEPWAKKVLATSVAWLVFGLFVAFIPSNYTVTQPATTSVIAGMTVFASPFIAGAAWLPTSPWLNYAIYPIGHIIAISISLLLITSLLQRRYARRAAL